MIEHRLQDVALIAFLDAHLGLCQAQHGGRVGAVDVGVDQANFGASFGQSNGQVDGDGAFTDAPFAAGDSDDVFDAVDALAIGQGFLLGGFGCHFYRHIHDAWKLLHGFFAVLDDELPQGAGGRGQDEGKAHLSVVGLDIADHVELDQAFAQLGVLHRTQNL